MAIPNFAQQTAQWGQFGSGIGSALRNSQLLQEQKQQDAIMNPLKVEQQQLTNQSLRQNVQQRETLNPMIVEQQRMQNEQEADKSLRTELVQSASALFYYGAEMKDKIIPEMIEKYQGKPEVIAGLEALYATKNDKEYDTLALQMLQAAGGKTIGSSKSTGKIAELESMGLVQGTPEFQDSMKSLIFKDSEGKTSLKASDIKGINADVSKMTSEYKGVYAAAKDLDRLGALKSAPAQMAMIFKYMKSLDPASTVRESEYASARNTTGIPEQVLNAYNKAKDGSLLNDNQVKQFINVAKELSNSRAESVGANVSEYLKTYGSIIDEGRLDAFNKRADVKLFEIKPEKEPVISQGKYNSSVLGREISEQDILDTLAENPNLTREQLLKQLGVN